MPVRVLVDVSVVVGLAVPLCVLEPVLLGDGVQLGVPVWLELGVPLCDEEGESVSLALDVPVEELLAVSVDVEVSEGLELCEGVRVGVPLLLWLAVPVRVLVDVSVVVVLGVPLSVEEMLLLPLCVRVIVRVEFALRKGVGDSLRGTRMALPLDEELPLEEELPLVEELPLEDADADAVAVAVDVPLQDGGLRSCSAGAPGLLALTPVALWWTTVCSTITTCVSSLVLEEVTTVRLPHESHQAPGVDDVVTGVDDVVLLELTPPELPLLPPLAPVVVFVLPAGATEHGAAPGNTPSATE